jgi:anti-sigma factor RsiW
VTAWTEPQLAAYLLGRLPPPEQERLEESYFEDDALHEHLQATADDLIAAYLSGGLSSEDRAHFESHFLASPVQRERLEFIRALTTAVAPRKRAFPNRLVWRLATAAALILATGSLVWRPSVEVAPDRTAESLATPAVPSAATPLPEASDPLVRVGPKPANVRVAASTRRVRFEVAVDDRHPSYDAILRRRSGREVWRAEGIAPERPGVPLVFSIPARLLAAGDYVLALRGEVMRGEAPTDGAAEYEVRIQSDAPRESSPRER